MFTCNTKPPCPPLITMLSISFVVMREGAGVACDLCPARACASWLSLAQVRARGHARAADDRRKFYVIKFHNLLVEMLVIYYQE